MTTLNIGGMSCEHCVKAVTQALSAVPGISGVKVDLKAGTAAFQCDGSDAALAAARAAVEEEGYTVQ
jgi:copper chaperone